MNPAVVEKTLLRGAVRLNGIGRNVRQNLGVTEVHERQRLAR